MIRGAFDGLTVLDFTQGVAGPHASMLLALHGADVIKIEPPEGDWGRALGELKGDHCAHSVAFNRGKRSIALDLKSPDGIAVVNKIAAKAHVVMESFRPGVIARLGFGYEAIRKINSKVVYCSVSGFGQTGPYSKRPTVDGLIQAFSGMMVMNRLPDGTPWRQGMIAVDVTTGLYTFNALSTAILRQVRFGEGSYIDSSLMKAAAAYQGAKLMEYVFSNGAPPPLYMPAGSYKTKNGHIMLSAMRPHHFQALFELIGRKDIADDPELQGHEARIRNAPRIIKALQEEMPKKTTEEWIALLQPKEVFCERVNNYADFLEHPHVKESGAVDWIEQDGFGRMPVANIPGLPRAAEDPERQHAPHIGEDGPDILKELGYGAAEIDAIFKRGGIRPPELAAKAAD
ncbi:MAG TPA: CoA transferase [Reyranella sp.]|jgi:crotonobetainyl-CoA:carnitine CoA-transferase CaiB-like acyl-CoA transferase|nr:CoA transferase [Reyranella sp.]